MKKKYNRQQILKILGIIGLFLLVFGLSYALFTVTLNGTKKAKISTGDSDYDYELCILSVNYDEVAVRPVITLNADTTFSSGNGSKLNPYVIN